MLKRMAVFAVVTLVSFSAFGQMKDDDVTFNNALTNHTSHIDSPSPMLTIPAQFAQGELHGYVVSSQAVTSHRKRRAVRIPSNPEATKVKLFVADFSFRDKNGLLSRWIGGETIRPLVLGNVYKTWFKRPGDADWTLERTSGVDAAEVGLYRTFYLHVGNDFFDVLPDGTKRPWNPGLAEWKIEEITPDGTTSASEQVPVGTGQVATSTLGPLQNIVIDNDKRQLVLVGVFPPPPVATLLQKVHTEWGDMYWTAFVNVDANNVINIPPEVGDDIVVVVGTKYPDAEFSTREITISPAVGSSTP